MSAERSARRVASNTAVQVAGKGVVLAIGFVSIAVLTRYLGPGDYGRYTLALMYMQLFAVLADVGLFTTVVRDISQRAGAHRGAGGQHAHAAAGPVAGRDRAGARRSACCCPTSPTCAWRSCSPALPLLFGMLGTTFAGAVLQARLRMGRAVVADVAGRAVGLGLVGLVVALTSASTPCSARPPAAPLVTAGGHLAAHPPHRRRAAAPGARGVAAPAARPRCRSGSRWRSTSSTSAPTR